MNRFPLLAWLVSAGRVAQRWLTAPSVWVVEPGAQRQARLLAALTLVFLLATTAGALASWVAEPGNVGAVALFALSLGLLPIYRLSRTRYHVWGAGLLLGVLTVIAFFSTLYTPASDAQLAILVWAFFGLIVGIGLANTRGLLLLIGAHGLELLLLRQMRPDLNRQVLFATGGWLVSLDVLTLVVIYYREAIERDRLNALRTAATEVQQLNSALEQRVAQRTEALNALHTSRSQLQQQAAQLTTLNEIGRAVAAVTDLDTTLRNILLALQSVLPLDVFYVGLYDAASARVTYPIYYDSGRLWAEPATQLNEGSTAARAIATRQAFIANRTPEEVAAQADSPYLKGDRTRISACILAAPLVIGERLLGVVSVHSYQFNLYTDEHLTLLTSAVYPIAIAIENARLYEAWRVRADQLATLNEIGRAVSTVSNLAGVLEQAYQQLKALISLDAFYIALYDAVTTEISYPFMIESGQRWQEPTAPLVGHNLLSRTLQTRQAYLLNRTPAEIAARTPEHALGDRSKVTASFMIAPLPVGERVIGVITAHSYTLQAYTADHLTLLTGVGYQVAIAIENARLFEAEQRRVALLEALHHTGLDISAQLDLPTLLQTIVEQSVRLLNGHMGELYLVRSDQTGLDLVVNHNLHTDYTVPHLHMGEGVSGHVAQTGQPLIVPDYHAWSGRVPRFAAGPYRAMLSIPILWRGQALGVINVVDDQPNRFKPDDVEVVRLLAAQAGIAIQTARLFEQTRRRADEMVLLYAMGAALTSGQNLYSALRALVKELRRVMIADAFYVVIYDHATDVISYPVYLNLDEDLHLASRGLSANPGLTGAVIATRQTLYLPDILQPEVQQAYKIVVIVDMGVRSYLGIPLMMDERVIGVLSVQAREANAYTPEQIRLLETLAAQVAITIEKYRLLEQLQQELAERKRAEVEIRQLNADLERRVLERTAQFETANKELEAFSYTVSHDLRAPLRGIDGFSRILLEDYAAQLDASGQRYLNRVRALTHRMGQLIDDLLAFSRLGRQALNLQTVTPRTLIQSVLAELRPDPENHPAEVVLGDLPDCQADPALLRQVFANLLSNALKYSRQRETARIEVGWRASIGAYFVRDNGAGFDMRYADKLFKVFQRLHADEVFEGTGVGLAIVHRIIQRHGGRIWAEAEVDQGATFYFTLPPPPEATR